jgi:organic radical activating enzyme
VELSLLLTARCNATCAHCSTSCGPYRTESLSRETLFDVMDQAARLSNKEPPQFYLSGGEPFLDFALLLDVIAHGSRLGGTVTCVTNGYWATSDAKAREIVASVKRAGLAELAVSSSRFHEQFVHRRRVGRVLAAARALYLPCTVKHVHSRSDRAARRRVSAWAKANGATRVQEIALLPQLRTGGHLPEREYSRRKGLPRGVCPARLISVAENGRTYTCCTPGGFVEMLELGSVNSNSLQQLRERFYLGGMQQLLRSHGPSHFARAIRERGLGERLRPAYGGVCDLCTHIAGDPQLAAIARETARAFEAKQMEEILGPLVTSGPPRHLRRAAI